MCVRVCVWGGADVIVGGGDPDGGDSHGDRDGGDTTTVCFAPNPNSPLFVLRPQKPLCVNNRSGNGVRVRLRLGLG